MTHLATVLVLCLLGLAATAAAADAPPKAGAILWANKLDSADALARGQGAGSIAEAPGRGPVMFVQNDQGSPGASQSFVLPVDELRGRFVFLSADVKAENVSAKPNSWNGIKVMAKIDTPAGTNWPQPDLPVGSFDWRRASIRLSIPADATAVTLILGLESVTGEAWFGDVRLSFARAMQDAPPAPADQPIFRGHDLPRLRGAMVQPNMSEDDLKVFAQEWGGNLIRWQLVHSREPNFEQDLAAYDRWIDQSLLKLDQVLQWAQAMGVKVVVDLHSPPGGVALQGGYHAATGDFWTNPKAQAKFIEVWQKMATRYKGNQTIWGFDLVNEPVDDNVAEGCEDWQALAERAGKAIREIDPQRTLIVEPPQWGGPQGFVAFAPVSLPNVVYSFHMYNPAQFTHQGVFAPSDPIAYPGTIAGQLWDKAALEKSMAPAIEFARKYRVHIYVGEFSAIRWAPGADRYLTDVIDIFEQNGWDWSYHAFREWDGWSIEHGPNKDDHRPTAEPTARKQVLLKWLSQNERAR